MIYITVFFPQVSAGRTHSAAWTAPPPILRTPGVVAPLQLGTPTTTPPQYTALTTRSIEAIRARLRLLYHFSDHVYMSWRLLGLGQQDVSHTTLNFLP